MQGEKFGIFSLLRINDDFVVKRPDGVRIAAFDDADRLMLTHEKRSEINGWDWRLPGGKVKDGDMYAAARKELADETGFVAKEWDHTYESLDERGIQYKLQYFSAKRLTPGRQMLHGAEQIIISWHSADEVFLLLRSRAISEDRTGRFLYQILNLHTDGHHE
jgi:8-oxo-dGTP pyrophosphatase MutT (NUDIX family)